MADRTVTTHLKLGVSGFTAGASTVKRDLKSMNAQFTETAGFASGFRSKLEAAVRKMPPIKIDADSSPADVKVAALRDRMEKLAQKKIGVDIDAGPAMSELAELEAELAVVQDGASFEVRAQVGQAMAELGTVLAEMRRIDGQTLDVNVDVDTNLALQSLGLLGKAASAIGPQAVAGLETLGSVGPGQVAKVGAAIALLPTVAQVAASGIVFALGAGLAAVGIQSAAQSEQVANRWGRVGIVIKRELADAAQPLEGSLLRAADLALSTFQKIKPALARIFKGLVPDIDAFLAGVAKGIQQLMPPLEKVSGSFGKMLTALGQQMPEIMTTLGETFEFFAKQLDEDPRMLADLVQDATDLLKVGAEVLAWADDVKAIAMSPLDPEGTGNWLSKFFLGGSLPEEMERSHTTVKNLTGAVSEASLAITKAQIAAEQNAGSTGKMSISAAQAAREYDNLSGKISSLVSLTSGAIQTEIGWQAALDRATEAAKKNGEATSTTTEKGRANKQALIDLATAANSYRQSLMDAGTPMAEVAAKLESQRAAFMKTADAMGFSKKEAANLATALGLVPGAVKTDVKLPGGKEANELLKEYQRKLKELDGKVVSTTIQQTTVRYTREQLIKKAQRAGGILRYEAGGIEAYAAGGKRPGPHIVNKPTVLYGEGAAPEAFIPYESRYRKRAIDLLSNVASDFGLEVYSAKASKQTGELTGTLESTRASITGELSRATGELTGTLGATGSLTGTIERVGEIGEAMTGGWVEGSAALGEAVTGMGDTVAGEIDGLTGSVSALASAVTGAKAAAEEQGSISGTKGKDDDDPGWIAGSGPKSKKKPKKKSNTGSITGEISSITGTLKPKPRPIEPRIAAYARGGIVTSPTLAWVGERGAEAVIPLTDPLRGRAMLRQAEAALPGVRNVARESRPQQVRFSAPAMAAASAGGVGPGGMQMTGPGGITINVNLAGAVVRSEADLNRIIKGVGMEVGLRAPRM